MWIAPKDQKVVGECLAEVRKRARVSQDELALSLGKPQSFVSTYERGERRVDILEFLVILAILKADPGPVFAEIAEKSANLVKKLGSTKRGKRVR